MKIVTIAILQLILALSMSVAQERQKINVGSKSFTESVILGEIVSQLASVEGFDPKVGKEASTD